MPTVETFRGPIDAAELGVTLPHEHVFVRHQEIELNWPHPEWEGEEIMISRAVEQLDELKRLGVDTVVDLTVPGLGRDIPTVKAVADRTSINLVAATGFYSPLHPLPTFFKNHGPGRLIDVADPLPAAFIRDIREGIGNTGVKAALIKVATDAHGLTEDLERVVSAAAVAHQETGAAITTHTHAEHFGGREQQQVLRRFGVPLEHVIIGHSGDTADTDYLKELMDNGSTLGMDRFGMGDLLGMIGYTPITDEERIDTVAELVGAGYTDRITLSHDAGVFSVNSGPAFRRRVVPEWNFSFIHRRVLPGLRERGVSDSAIHQMTVANPARLLVGAR